MNRQALEVKVVTIANRALGEKQYVSAIDILLGLGYLSPTILEDWRRGRFPYLEERLQANLGKLTLDALFSAMGDKKWVISNQATLTDPIDMNKKESIDEKESRVVCMDHIVSHPKPPDSGSGQWTLVSGANIWCVYKWVS